MVQYKYLMDTPTQALLSVCEAWNSAYNLTEGQWEYLVPPSAGAGRLTSYSIGQGIKAIDYDLNFNQPISMVGCCHQPHLDMLFCLGEHIDWNLPESGKRFHLFSGESYIGVSNELTKQGVLPAQKNMHVLEIKLPLASVQDLLPVPKNKGIQAEPSRFPCGKHRLSSSVQALLYQLHSCSYPAPLRQYYMQGKLLELTSVCLNEVIEQAGAVQPPSYMEDTACLMKIKQIIDSDPSASYSLSALSKHIGLNEYKLKKGFKELFGVPVHTYIVSQRLEAARLLLERGGVTVSQAAGEVGYSNISHFAAAFRKKYQVNPKEYLRQIER